MNFFLNVDDDQKLRKFMHALSAYGLPGFWQLRGKVFEVILKLFDLSFVLGDLGKPAIYIREHKGFKFKVRRGTSDNYVIDEVWNRGDYGSKPSGIVVDFGGNIGAYTVYASQSAKTVISLEPVSSNYSLLCDNIGINNLSSVIPVNSAVTNRVGTGMIVVHPVNLGMSSLIHHSSAGSTQAITTTTLPSLIEQFSLSRIDTLKCDIEGGEYMAFGHTAMQSLERIQSILMELHCNAVTPKSVYKLLRRFQKAGFLIEFKDVLILFLTGTGMVRFTAQKASA